MDAWFSSTLTQTWSSCFMHDSVPHSLIEDFFNKEEFLFVYNIFTCLLGKGKINRCRKIPWSLIAIYHHSGQNATSAMEILKKSGLDIIVASDMADAAEKVVATLPKSWSHL